MSSVDHGRDDTENYESVAAKIVSAVAEQDGTDPAELDPSLYEVVDPDALNALFAPTTTGHTRAGGHVMFTYCGYHVTTYSDGHVHVQAVTDSTASGTPKQDAASDD